MKKADNTNANNQVSLRDISEKDFRFLYTLLKNRNPVANISHRKMPTFNEHVKFVRSKPYSRWHIIFYKNAKAGSIYLSKQDEIGLFLRDDFQGKGIATSALKLLIENNPRARYLANVAPENKRSILFFKKNGFGLIQYTYELNISFGK